jgi:hypothetical protein
MDDAVLNEIQSEGLSLESMMAKPAVDLNVTVEDVEEFAPGLVKTINLGKAVTVDWDGNEEQHIGDMYEQFLQAVQQGKRLHKEIARWAGKTHYKYDRNTTFEAYLQDCLISIRWNIAVQIERDLVAGRINIAIRDEARSIGEGVMRAISKYLEGTPKERLIGVPEPGF